uniref:Uncharacterized protein n=1 Tax=Rhodnius prolixus TaxID=13249 RepID=T1IBU2_RHOPR
MSAYTRRKAKTKYRDRIRLEKASQEQSNGKSRKAGGVTIYRNINSFTDCHRVNIDISEIYLEMKDAKAGDVCLVNEKGQWHLQIRTRVCVYPSGHRVSYGSCSLFSANTQSLSKLSITRLIILHAMVADIAIEMIVSQDSSLWTEHERTHILNLTCPIRVSS